jgi:O-antigen/teichoic acid export membrane protein
MHQVSHTNENNRRIAKNTAMLYVRMLFTMVISLYTSRVVLITLGIENFGIYNVVGGVIVLFSFINNAMANATQRFLNFAMGAKNENEVDRVFSMSLTVHISIAILVLILGETIGLWFVNAKLNIPENKISSMQLVYQFSIFASCISIVRIPYYASIIAYEKMSFFAYSSIVESLLKLFIVYVLLIITFNKLIAYSILMFVISLVMFLVYKIYCNRIFSTCNYKFFYDKDMYKEMMSFSGWSLWGASANIGSNQGVNILLNFFYGVAINAAYGIANQVSGVIYGFVSNFQTAFRPQIIKSFAANESLFFFNLINRASKLSFFLLFLVSLPFIINCKDVLNLWLVNVPDYAVPFTQLIIISSLFDAISAPLWTANEATGKVKYYQILISLIIMLNIPISYIVLLMGYSPFFVILVRISLNICTLLFRIFYLQRTINLDVLRFVKEVVGSCSLVTVLSIPIPILIFLYVDGFNGVILSALFSVVVTSIVIFYVGLNTSERRFIVNAVKKNKYE